MSEVSMTRHPTVTVVIPVYNRERYVGEAVASVLEQSFREFELLVIDDASTDRTSEIVRSFRDPRLRLVRNERNQGIPGTRNEGIRLARGTYLAFLDSDDRARPERLMRQVAFLSRNSDHVGVGSWIRWIDSEGRLRRGVKRKPLSHEQIAAERLFRSGLENTTSMTRTEVLRKFGHDESYTLGSDFAMWARIAAEHRLANIPEVLVYKRTHPDRTSRLKASRKQQLRSKTYARQLEELEIPFDQHDLERHFLLRRLHKVGFEPDRSYVDWAEKWLMQLLEANRRANLYPEPAFGRVLGGFWGKVCWHARARLGREAWHRFFGSPLRPHYWEDLRARTRARIGGARTSAR
jgi:glycosyltransferase involved in cell wall biosynthesis